MLFNRVSYTTDNTQNSGQISFAICNSFEGDLSIAFRSNDGNIIYNVQYKKVGQLNVNMVKYVSFKFEPPHDKINKMSVRPAKTQISLDICPV